MGRVTAIASDRLIRRTRDGEPAIDRFELTVLCRRRTLLDGTVEKKAKLPGSILSARRPNSIGDSLVQLSTFWQSV